MPEGAANTFDSEVLWAQYSILFCLDGIFYENASTAGFNQFIFYHQWFNQHGSKQVFAYFNCFRT